MQADIDVWKQRAEKMPHLCTVLTAYQDDGFGNLMWAPEETDSAVAAFVAEGR